MLRWHDELEPDPRLLAYAVRYADALVALQDEKDIFQPGWIRDTLAPLDIIRESPETSLSVTFCLSAPIAPGFQIHGSGKAGA